MGSREFTNDIGEAQYLVAALVDHRRTDGREAAIALAARAIGISRWTLWGIFYGTRKTITSDILGAIRREYLALCESQLRLLEAEVSAVRQRCGDTDAIVDLGAEAMRLVSRLREARERQR